MRFCRDIQKVSKALFFYSFPRDFCLYRLREGPRHLLVINLMQAVRRGGCDSTIAVITMVEAATADIPGAGDMLLAEDLSTQCVNQMCKL